MNYVIAIALACAALFGSYFYGVSAGKDECAATLAREDRVAQVAQAATDNAVARAIAKIEVKHVTLRQETEREIQTNVVYRDCRHSAGQLQRLNAALSGTEAEPAGSGLVPTADALGR